MNLRTRTNVISCIILPMLIVLSSCKKSGNEDWGISNVYMPQAAMKDGGRTNNYPVPWSTATGTRNYIIDSVNNTVDIVLGVYRGGLEELDPFSVDVVVRTDTTNQLIASGTVANAVILPPDIYSIPATAATSAGQREARFFLRIDSKKLREKYPAYSGKKLVLAVGIFNPSKYDLNKQLSTTVIIIESKGFIY